MPGDSRHSAADIEAGCREHYEDGQLYDYEYRRRRQDVRFYRAMALEILGGPGRILEIACGTGRVTTALVRDGHRVVGFDLSRHMLAHARARVGRIGRAARARAALVRADMRTFALAEPFPLVILAFNSLEHLYTHTEISAFLNRVREHVAPGGRFVFDVQNPDLKWLCRDPRKRWGRVRFRHPVTGLATEYSTNHVYDPVSQIVVVRFYYRTLAETPAAQRLAVSRLSQRMFFPAELEALMRSHGFDIEARYGDFAGEPLDRDCESQVLVCRVPTR